MTRDLELSIHDRNLITCAALLAMGSPELEIHLKIAKENNLTKKEMVELMTHLSFYVGWPKAWHAFTAVKKIFE